jgi:hypothetical protein
MRASSSAHEARRPSESTRASLRGAQLSAEHRNRLTRARLVLAGFGWRVFLRRYRRPLLGLLLLACLTGVAIVVVVFALSGSSPSSPTSPVQASAATLAAVPTNHVTGSGTATVQLRGDTATVTLDTVGLLNGSPHLAHIHGEGRGTCPTAVNARLHHGHRSISTGDAIRLYGSTLTSLTEWGSTSGAVPTNINLNRYPASGKIRYKRTIPVSRLVADLIRDRDAVIVVHGIDYNYNHIYDFAALGVSDLDKTLPGEATAPALCGPLRPAPTKSVTAGITTEYVASLRPAVAPATASSTATTSASATATETSLTDYDRDPDHVSLLCDFRHPWAIGS